jgi:hypothetical protein
MQRFVLTIAAAGTLATTLACGGDARLSAPTVVAPAEASLEGNYGLTPLNDRALPQSIGSDGFGAIDALSGTIQLLPDAHFLDIFVSRRRGPGGIEIHVDTVRGDYLSAGRTLLFEPEGDGDPYFFDMHDGKLTGFGPAFTIVYTRR